MPARYKWSMVFKENIKSYLVPVYSESRNLSVKIVANSRSLKITQGQSEFCQVKLFHWLIGKGHYSSVAHRITLILPSETMFLPKQLYFKSF